MVQTATFGDMIIQAIKDGLGLIGDLAKEFLDGFTALVWDSTNSTLTKFAEYALIMLGVAITFAVVKLCLNIIRSNTGA